MTRAGQEEKETESDDTPLNQACTQLHIHLFLGGGGK